MRTARRVETSSRTLWIGDGIAFRRFREVAETPKRVLTERAVNAALFADELEKSPASDLYSGMREVVADTAIPTVGGFVSVISNRGPGFRHAVYSDMLFNWPEDRSSDYIININDQIDYGASGENADYAVAQISTSYPLNMVGFYLLKAKKAFLFFGVRNGLPDECLVLDDLAPTDVARRFSETIGFDPRWLLLISAAAPNRTSSIERSPRHPNPDTGAGFTILPHANTLPLPGTKIPPLLLVYPPQDGGLGRQPETHEATSPPSRGT